MSTEREAMTVDLEPVSQTWLDDPRSILDLADQAMDVRDQVIVDAW
jgi:hypothetical protein